MGGVIRRFRYAPPTVIPLRRGPLTRHAPAGLLSTIMLQSRLTAQREDLSDQTAQTDHKKKSPAATNVATGLPP